MPAKGIHHLGVAVEDLDAAVDTYRRVFGAELERRDVVEAQGVEAAAMRVGESRVLLDELFTHTSRPGLQYRHRWQPHDMVFWDNRSVLHLAAGCPDHLRRRLHRTTIEGDRPY